MRKEIVFAIVFGSILGLIVAFGIWRVNSALSPKSDEGAKTEASPTPTAGFLISLAKPENNDVILESPLQLNGLTRPNVFVAVSGEEKDYLTSANDQGLFQESVDMVGGINQLLLTSFEGNGGIATTKALIIYSSEFKKVVESLTSANSGTPEPAAPSTATDSVREKVEKKVEEALNKPKAYLGLVADISETTIQLKTAEGEIQQVGTATDTAFIKDGTTAKVVSFKDLAIGDYIVAMGFKNGNSVLNAKRILITEPPSSLKREAIFGKITRLTTKDFAVTFANSQGEPLVTPNKNAVYLALSAGKVVKSKFSDIKEGSQVVVFGEKGEKSFAARTIFIVTP